MILSIPLTLHVSLNSREHWATKAKRIKRERSAVAWAFAGARRKSQLAQLQAANPVNTWVVTITRIAPRRVDGDNLISRCKGVRDEVARHLGIDDGSEAIDWRYRQEQAPGKVCGVRVEIQTLTAVQLERLESIRAEYVAAGLMPALANAPSARSTAHSTGLRAKTRKGASR